MSKAFTRESDADGLTELPDRIISTAPNFVTESGLRAIASEVERLAAAQGEALARNDRELASRIARDLRYWTLRLQSAQLKPAPTNEDVVQFGSQVTLARSDGRVNTWRIVGEDEADPAAGTLSHTSPLARALLGKEVGEEVRAGATEAEIVAIGL